MAVSNYTNPFPTFGAYYNIETCVFNIMSVASESLRNVKVNKVIESMAHLYLLTNGAATTNQLATFLQTTPDMIDLLLEFTGGNSTLEQLVLWTNFIGIPNAEIFPVPTGYISLAITLPFLAFLTTSIRLFYRGVLPMKTLLSDITLAIATVMVVLIGFEFGAGEASRSRNLTSGTL